MSRVPQTILFLLAFLSASVNVLAAGEGGAASVEAPPRVAVSPRALDFGTEDLARPRNLSKIVLVRNSGGGEITLEGLQPSNAALLNVVPLLDKDADGRQMFRLVVTLNPKAAAPGVFSEHIMIATNGGADRVEVTGTFTGDVARIPLVVYLRTDNERTRAFMADVAKLLEGSRLTPEFRLTADAKNFQAYVAASKNFQSPPPEYVQAILFDGNRRFDGIDKILEVIRLFKQQGPAARSGAAAQGTPASATSGSGKVTPYFRWTLVFPRNQQNDKEVLTRLTSLQSKYAPIVNQRLVQYDLQNLADAKVRAEVARLLKKDSIDPNTDIIAFRTDPGGKTYQVTGWPKVLSAVEDGYAALARAIQTQGAGGGSQASANYRNTMKAAVKPAAPADEGGSKNPAVPEVPPKKARAGADKTSSGSVFMLTAIPAALIVLGVLIWAVLRRAQSMNQ